MALKQCVPGNTLVSKDNACNLDMPDNTRANSPRPNLSFFLPPSLVSGPAGPRRHPAVVLVHKELV
jgi:hypothetical protein